MQATSIQRNKKTASMNIKKTKFIKTVIGDAVTDLKLYMC